MKSVYVVEALRTPFGSYGGVLAGESAPKLASAVMAEILKRTGLPGEAVDEVIIGQVILGGAGQAPARQAMRGAGIPDSAHAMTINKVCGSGLKSAMLGAGQIMLGEAEIAVTGGMENMSKAPYALDKARFGYRMGNAPMLDLMIHDALGDPYTGKLMGEITEKVIEDRKITREEQDEYALRSYKLSQKAVEEGIFDDEIVPYTISGKKGDTVVDKDEEPFNVKFEKVPQLRPVFAKDGTITAANASTISDGAAILLLASEEAVKKYNLKPKAKVVSYATNSIHPDRFPEAPVGAIEKAVKQAGLTYDDIDLYEINEAFAAVPLMAINDLGLDPEKVNVNGGAVSIGHPVGSSGGRIAATVIREMKAKDLKYGLATLCIGGGEGVAMIFENVK
ncbi:thiolase family protein [Limisalsivibrio acetivorans]|uniref:thiolase family protein n=1 Tax=Limisalsivibrio acetivorans TaxID=1304888 RepID=UPI0003B4A4B1|nr:thiolase family protein [Limisalsivibrio acetivorans]